MSKYEIDHRIPNALIDGILSDLSKVNIKDYNQLFCYSYKVAGTVGLMMCDIMGVKENSLKFNAIYLGIAMQLTNISRDVKEDLLRDRIYIPKEIRVHVKNDLHEIPLSDKLQSEFSKDLKKLSFNHFYIQLNQFNSIYESTYWRERCAHGCHE